jgi:hypothetical protein
MPFSLRPQLPGSRFRSSKPLFNLQFRIPLHKRLKAKKFRRTCKCFEPRSGNYILAYVRTSVARETILSPLAWKRRWRLLRMSHWIVRVVAQRCPSHGRCRGCRSSTDRFGRWQRGCRAGRARSFAVGMSLRLHATAEFLVHPLDHVPRTDGLPLLVRERVEGRGLATCFVRRCRWRGRHRLLRLPLRQVKRVAIAGSSPDAYTIEASSAISSCAATAPSAVSQQVASAIPFDVRDLVDLRLRILRCADCWRSRKKRQSR